MLYRDGEWDYLSSVGVLGNICVRALKNDATVERIDDAIWELEDLVYEEPPAGWVKKPDQGIVIKETCSVCQRRTCLYRGSRVR